MRPTIPPWGRPPHRPVRRRTPPAAERFSPRRPESLHARLHLAAGFVPSSAWTEISARLRREAMFEVVPEALIHELPDAVPEERVAPRRAPLRAPRRAPHGPVAGRAGMAPGPGARSAARSALGPCPL
jgi:hypothetical protein